MSIPKNTPFKLKRIIENIDRIPTKGFNEDTQSYLPNKKRNLCR